MPSPDVADRDEGESPFRKPLGHVVASHACAPAELVGMRNRVFRQLVDGVRQAMQGPLAALDVGGAAAGGQHAGQSLPERDGAGEVGEPRQLEARVGVAAFEWVNGLARRVLRKEVPQADAPQPDAQVAGIRRFELDPWERERFRDLQDQAQVHDVGRHERARLLERQAQRFLSPLGHDQAKRHVGPAKALTQVDGSWSVVHG